MRGERGERGLFGIPPLFLKLLRRVAVGVRFCGGVLPVTRRGVVGVVLRGTGRMGETFSSLSAMLGEEKLFLRGDTPISCLAFLFLSPARPGELTYSEDFTLLSVSSTLHAEAPKGDEGTSMSKL